MAEPTTTPEDGTKGTPETGGEPVKAPEPVAKTVTLTQPELDQLIQDRALRETKAKYPDYDDLKAKAAKLDEAEEQKKTDLEKAAEAKSVAERERDEAKAEALATRRETAIQLEASKQGADTDLVFAVLANSDQITVVDGKVVGVEAAVAKLLEEKPHLKIGAARKSGGGEFGGNDGEPIQDKIRALEQKGDKESIREAVRLKVEQGLSSG